MANQRARRIRDPRARQKATQRLPAERQLEEVWNSVIDIWDTVSPFSSSQTADYTVTGDVAIERVIMTNTSSATVTLPANPDDMTEVIVKRKGAQVTIDGNGNNIDGSATLILAALYDGPHLIYADADGEWSII